MGLAERMNGNGKEEVSHDGIDTLVESHEDRLLRVEEQVVGTRLDLAQTRGELEKMSLKMNDGFDRLFDKIVPLGDKVTVLTEKSTAASARLDKIETDAEARGARWKQRKGWALGVVAAIGGAALSKAGESLWSWLTR